MDLVLIINFQLKKESKGLEVQDYASRYERDLGRTGRKIDAKGIDFSRKF